MKTKQPSTDNPRLNAVKILIKIETRDVPFGVALEDVPIAQRGAVRNLAAGVLRHRTLCETAIARLLKKSFSKLDVEVANIFRLAAYEKYFCDVPLYALTNEFTGITRNLKLSSASGLVNAVLRRLPDHLPEIKRDKFVEYLEKKYSHPRWMIKRWITQFGEDGCEKLCDANNKEAPLCLRVNSQLTTRAKVLLALAERDLIASAGSWTPDSIIVENVVSFTDWPEWQRGELIVQDEAAQMVSILANPQKDWTVYDLCAAPGGKTTHLAQLMEDGNLQAFDLTERRAQLVRNNCARLKLSNVQVRTGDFRQFDLLPADLVLLDAPCSGTGTLRRHPDIKWSKTPEQITQLVELQKELLNHAAKMVRSGGFLVYSTCSVECEENQEQANHFLQEHSDWRACERWESFPGEQGADGAFAIKMRFEPRA
ncbi:MAG: 16S rRNA (cytosine(967)-C(5))-methyltransferase RsmB [Abditibacteriaceae bacterium]